MMHLAVTLISAIRVVRAFLVGRGRSYHAQPRLKLHQTLAPTCLFPSKACQGVLQNAIKQPQALQFRFLERIKGETLT